MSTHVIIIGAGLSGSLMGCYLARAGYRVSIYERRPDPRKKGYLGGRSINLALSIRGITGLAGAGLAEMVMNTEAIPMRGRMIHSVGMTPETKPIFQPYSHDPNDAIHSVSRGGLNLALIHAAAAYENVQFVFDSPCVDVDLDAPAAVFESARGLKRVGADLILGADGAFSPVRARLQKTDRFEYSQSYLEHGYKELMIPAAPGGVALDLNALHIWPRGSSMMIALPNRDQSFTCTLFWPLEGEHGFASLHTADEVNAYFGRYYSDAMPLMPTLAEDYFQNPTGSLVTVRCSPWHWQAKVCLFGDAAHAIVPFYGQGMNAAFEDCLALSQCLARHSTDREAALAEFQELRKPNADAIADMALANFVEMRDKVGSPDFLYRKKVEQTVHQAFPDRVTPQYNLVSFSTVPYVDARRRGAELDVVLDRVIARIPAVRLQEVGDDVWKDEVRQCAGELLQSGRAVEPNEIPVIDITPAITAQMGVWPGDTPMSREVLCDLARGDNITLSTLRSTVHLGAHADGPNHYGIGGPGIGERSLMPYLGPCHVLAVTVARGTRGTRVRVSDVVGGIDVVRHPRVLIRTGTFLDFTKWNEDFAGLSVELIDALAARGVITIGVDTPSVDLFSSKDLEAHHAILRHDISILEGLALEGVPPGEYELIAAPLKLIGFDASPVRALLRPLRITS